ncbi:MAG: methionyl-tRNA formyltransferase [Gammaproteobacteria bacterium]|nr:methionyl-tRNA formyltransferase [Gammaproteobacteria bacterium]
MKIIFAGTPEFAATALQALLDSEHEVCAVYTQPDRPAGRGRKLTASAVKQLALEHHLPVHQPVSLKSEDEQALLQQYDADIMVVVAYGLLLPRAVLEIPRLGCINIHASLLPRWRGAAPIQRAIQAGDSATGVTIMQMDVGLDTGDMLLTVTTPISDTDTAQSLHDRLAELGSRAAIDALEELENGRARPIKQDDAQANYAHKMEKAEAQIDWSQPAIVIDRLVRAFNPWPVAQTLFEGKTLRIWQASAVNESTSATPGTIISADKQGINVATGDGILRLLQIQKAGSKAMDAAAFVNGHPELKQGDIKLGEEA